MSYEKNSTSKKPLYLPKTWISAVAANDVAKLKLLNQKGLPLGVSDKQDNNLLHHAIHLHPEGTGIEVFEYLLTLEKISKESVNSFGNTPLTHSFGFSYSPEYAIRLIESGCEIDYLTANSDTILHLAVRNKWLEVVELLIEKGFDVDSQNDDKETPLHLAAKQGDFDSDMVWALLFFGADPNITCVTEVDSFGGNHTVYTYLTLFDLIYGKPELYDRLNLYDMDFSLYSFMRALENPEDESFHKLLEMTRNLNYTYDDLRELSIRFAYLSPELFQLFFQEFDYVVEDMFKRCCLDVLFFCEERFLLDQYCKNMFIILQSDIVSSLVEAMNSSKLPLLGNLVLTFNRMDEEILTEILCGCLTYGADLTANAMNTVFMCFGYCELFKILLHMDIEQIDRWIPQHYILPRMIYDTNLSLDSVISREGYDERTSNKLSEYITLRKFKLGLADFRVPKLIELARNKVREFIIHRYGVKNSRQFYTILKKLPLARAHKEIISFEQKLYPI